MRILSKFKTLVPLVIGILILSLVSCEKDEDKVILSTEGNLVLATLVPNPDGFSGSGYIQLIDDVEPKNISNTTAFPVPYTFVACTFGNDVYVLPSFGGEAKIQKYTRTDGKLSKTGEGILPEYSGATCAVVKDDKLYISCTSIGKILVYKQEDMTKIKEIDLSSYGVGDLNPDPAAMLIRDNLLYIGLSQTVGGFFPALDRPYSDMLIVDTDTDTPLKMITSTTPGISYATKPLDPKSIFMDENNDIYVTCGSVGGVPGHSAGILRIKNGETEFDDSYYFDLSNASIEGEANKITNLMLGEYYQDGKFYNSVHIDAYSSEPQDILGDRTIVPVEIDLYNKTIKTLDLPKSNFIGRCATIYDAMVIFGLATASDIGLYTYDLITGESSNGAVVTTEGHPAAIYAFD